jgi:hypothetical protein
LPPAIKTVTLFVTISRRSQAIFSVRATNYNAEHILVDFAVTACDEVELERLTGALLGVVEETVQPEGVSLWLRSTTDH